MGHELRTALASIMAHAELLGKETAERPQEVQRRSADEIRRNGQLLFEMVNNTINAAKLEEGVFELHPEPVDLRRRHVRGPARHRTPREA